MKGEFETFFWQLLEVLDRSGKGSGERKSIWDYNDGLRLNLGHKFPILGLGFCGLGEQPIEARLMRFTSIELGV